MERLTNYCVKRLVIYEKRRQPAESVDAAFFERTAQLRILLLPSEADHPGVTQLPAKSDCGHTECRNPLVARNELSLVLGIKDL